MSQSKTPSLIERLHEQACACRHVGMYQGEKDCYEAAAELTRLSAEKAEVEQQRDDYKSDYFRRHNDVVTMMDRAIAAESALKQAEIRARNADHSACFLFTDRLKALLAKERGCGECWKGQRCGDDCHMKDVTT